MPLDPEDLTTCSDCDAVVEWATALLHSQWHQRLDDRLAELERLIEAGR